MFVKIIKKENFILFLRFSKNSKNQITVIVFIIRDKEDVWEIKREYWTGEEKTPTKLTIRNY